MKPTIMLAALLLAGCAAPSQTITTTPTLIDGTLICRGMPMQGHHGTVVELGMDTSPLSAGRNVIYDHMDVAYDGRLNMTATWTVNGEGTVDLLVKQPGKEDQVVTTSPFELRLVNPPHGDYSMTLRAHPVARDVSFAMKIRYNYTVVSTDGNCPGTL